MATKVYYPIFADLEGRRCLVVGGGLIAQRKVTMLLACGAKVTVISPQATRRLMAYARKGNIRVVARQFRPGDVRGAWLVCTATNDQAVNERVFDSATRSNTFTNVVDQPSLCSFIAPAILRRGPLTVAVSTGGASPSLAKRVRREVDQMLGREYVPMLHLLSGLRGIAKRTLPSYRDRKHYFDELVHGRVFGLVRRAHYRQAKHEALATLTRHAGSNGA